ncbi:MAG TPA: TIGR03862 family flavoprotein [Chthoniobacteraceae bacterium]|nr:TIGR03862 family flavoprotein [Chthoniobacteraceae bacterium]
MRIAIIGGGPAGLRAAEVAATGGAKVTLFDAKPSVGRKFLVAGRGGLNLTNSKPFDDFVKQYTGDGWRSLIGDFDPDALRAWAASLGVETFAASTGRIYPKELKAAPLLRRWVQRLRELGVTFAMRHRWTGLVPGSPLKLNFDVEGKPLDVEADVVILALGGSSWPETGSDGAWTGILGRLGIGIEPLEPANCGWELPWPPAVLSVAEGKPLKNIVVRAGDAEAAGELLITRHGIEGGAIYQLGPALRAMKEPAIAIDFKPSFTAEQLAVKLKDVKHDFTNEAKKRWKLSDAAIAVLGMHGPFNSVESLACEVKCCALRFAGPRPLAEAISTAGGVKWDELDAGLMLKKLPGVFVAGEMIDWEAPTGGYLIQGCFATGERAARSALMLRKE